jgi:phytoene dehydrogenase-like protein
VASRDPDVVVIGSGHNGLVGAGLLARHGLRVMVLEANPRRPGGCVDSAELTAPGFIHDVGAGFFPFATRSPAFDELGLAELGVQWLRAPFDSCHPALDGSYACLAGDRELLTSHFGSARDGVRCREFMRWFERVERDLLPALLGPWPTLRPLFGLGLGDLGRLVSVFSRSGAGLARHLFESEAARRVLPSLALHADFAPDDALSAGLGVVLGGLGVTAGYVMPRGGARALTNVLLSVLERFGGELRLGARVARIVTRAGRAVAVELAGGEEIPAPRGVLADVAAPTLLLDLLPRAEVPWWVVRKMRRFPSGFGTFKVDWALAGPVPWKVEAARSSAVVHVGESLGDLARFVREVRQGVLPERPYLVVGQQSLFDPSRAPAERQTLYAYTHVPARLDWSSLRERFADRIEARIAELAPGFPGLVLGRHVGAPPDLEAGNANLLGGDHLGGSAHVRQQFFWRPVFPYFRYRMPVRGLYLGSSYTHPGGGVHGMCGYNAARRLLRELG